MGKNTDDKSEYKVYRAGQGQVVIHRDGRGTVASFRNVEGRWVGCLHWDTKFIRGSALVPGVAIPGKRIRLQRRHTKKGKPKAIDFARIIHNPEALVEITLFAMSQVAEGAKRVRIDVGDDRWAHLHSQGLFK